MEPVKKQKQSRQIVFRTLQTEPQKTPSPSGEGIYEWIYMDSDGKIQKDKMNVYESIQSFARQTNYKERIARGELIENGTGLYMDTTKLGSDYASLDKYLGGIASDIQALIQNGELPSQVGKDPAENPKTPGESPQPSTQEVGGTKQNGGNEQ